MASLSLLPNGHVELLLHIPGMIHRDRSAMLRVFCQIARLIQAGFLMLKPFVLCASGGFLSKYSSFVLWTKDVHISLGRFEFNCELLFVLMWSCDKRLTCPACYATRT